MSYPPMTHDDRFRFGKNQTPEERGDPYLYE